MPMSALSDPCGQNSLRTLWSPMESKRCQEHHPSVALHRRRPLRHLLHAYRTSSDCGRLDRSKVPQCRRHNSSIHGYTKEARDLLPPLVTTSFKVYRFYQTKQIGSESLDMFYARLRQLARHCVFAGLDAKFKTRSSSRQSPQGCATTPRNTTLPYKK